MRFGVKGEAIVAPGVVGAVKVCNAILTLQSVVQCGVGGGVGATRHVRNLFSATLPLPSSLSLRSLFIPSSPNCPITSWSSS